NLTYYPLEKIAQEKGSIQEFLIVNNTIFWDDSLGYIHAIKIINNTMVDIFSAQLLSGSPFQIGYGASGNILLYCPTTKDVYDFELYPQYKLIVNVLGVPSNVYWNISINPVQSLETGYYENNVNKTVVNSTYFTVWLFPISYYLNISDPPQYEIYSIQTYGKGIQMNA
ncbi:MAG: hypothetical protein ACP5M8_08260, partial [Caldisphaera sp.]